MANIASILKAEIARVARKEVRSEIESLKKASAQQRSAIAALRREVAALQKELRQAGRARSAETKAQPAEDRQYRFSATRLAAHRKKLGLSAADYGRLVGMSGASVYLWEQGQVRPRPEQVRQLGALKQLSRRAALERLASTE